MPRLQHLDLSENEIPEVAQGSLVGLPELKKLVMSKNKLTTLANFPSMPSLEHLILVENQIASVKELAHLNPASPALK